MSDQSNDPPVDPPITPFTEFNDFDRNYDKENNTYEEYALQAQQYIYFRNL
jgi:hypothetical protein